MDWRSDIGIAEGTLFLAISPHPDDVELGCGGTIRHLARHGHKVHLAVVTDGRLGTRDPNTTPDEVARIRALEQKESAKVLGAELRMLGLPDGGPHDPYRLRDLAVQLIRSIRPDWILAPDPWLPFEAHSDHRAVGLAVAEAALLCGLPHFASGEGAPHTPEGVLFYFPSTPTLFVPLSPQDAADRAAAIACHRSQFAPGDRYLQRLGQQMESDGARIGAELAERLHPRRRIDLHIPQAPLPLPAR